MSEAVYSLTANDPVGHPLGSRWGVVTIMAGFAVSMFATAYAVGHKLVALLLGVALMYAGFLASLLLVLAIGAVLKAFRKPLTIT